MCFTFVLEVCILDLKLPIFPGEVAGFLWKNVFLRLTAFPGGPYQSHSIYNTGGPNMVFEGPI